MAETRINVTLGTAGHIDHGKTELVKLLTGCDTDRLKEEKERGMSIELGYAPCVVADLEVGIVDVPGHERFVKTMVAGATGIDGVILVVAADDGVMPQTREHLDILTLLGVEHGIVALTKIDRVDAEHVELVRDDLRAFLRGTFLDGAPILPMSSITGQGYDAFYEALVELVRSITPKQAGGVFRLPVERAFSSKGYGTIVTGIPVAGSITTGDEVVLLPQNETGRVSAIEVYGRPAETALAGQCAALNVRQWEKAAVNRGDVVALPGFFEPSQWYACRLHVLAQEKLFLKNGAKVKFHTGTAETGAAVYLMAGDQLRGGEHGLVQMRLDEPVVAGPGDHFIVRALSPVLTIGGGTVIEALPFKLKRTRPGVVEDVAERAEAVQSERTFVEYCVKDPAELPASAAEVSVRTKLPLARTQALLDELVEANAILAVPPKHYIHAGTVPQLGRRVLDALEQFHKEWPQSPGLAAEQIGERVGLGKHILGAVLGLLTKGGRVIEHEGRYSLATHTAAFSDEERGRLDRVEAAFTEALFKPPSARDVAERMGLSERDVAHAIGLLVEHGRLVRVAPDMLLHRDAVDEAKRRLLAHFEKEDRFESVQFKYLLDTTRKYALPLLDYFDQIGLTRRAGNTRFLKAKG